MKRLTIFVIGLALAISAIAKDLEKDITMVSYEQSWTDDQGTLALKNNTETEIKNLKFIITYLDMSDKEMDYKEFSEIISIAPGMTKKLDIPAYEHNRYYHYYKTEGGSDHTTFKIGFKLFDYNMDNLDTISKDDYFDYGDEYDSEHVFLYIIIGVIILLVFVSITVGLYIIVALMAQKRNRSVVAWVLLSLIATPILMIIILLFIGDAQRGQIE